MALKFISVAARATKASFKLDILFLSQRCSSTASLKTCLYGFHAKHGAKFGPFAGYDMPIQYQDQSLIESHHWTRSSCSLFDVSHMLQLTLRGPRSKELITRLTVADLDNLKQGSSQLSLLMNDQGGIKDDLIVSKMSDDYLKLVLNAACRQKDLDHIRSKASALKYTDVAIEEQADRGLIALQGPKAASVLSKLVSLDLTKMTFMESVDSVEIAGIPGCHITRCGYTGEDGFEISMPSTDAESLAQALINDREVKLAGLGARDSLRLEAGLCLYGNDIDETTTPVEAGLLFTISKARRQAANFPGAQIILEQIKSKPKRKRVGLKAVSASGPPARSQAPILDSDSGKEIGRVTSGCPSPSLKANIAMGYVPIEYSKIGQKVKCQIRGRQAEYEVVKMPFVPSHYYVVKK